MEKIPHSHSESRNHATYNDVCKNEFPTMLPDAAAASANRNKKKSFVCEICNRKFTQKVCLQMHFRTHTGEKPYICELCQKPFARKDQLGRHLAVHRGYKPHSCDICSKSFSQKGALKSHLISHTGIKPYLCEVCNKTFTVNYSLRIHRLKHTGEIYKPHSCILCNKAFCLKSSLKNHLRSHTGEKPHVCETCNKPFALKSSLRSHIITHSNEKPHVCGFCCRSFSIKKDLKTHLHSHKVEKPPRERTFKCHLCNKAFFNAGGLKQHLFTHTGCKPYTCDLCNKAFTSKAGLKRHHMVHSREKSYICGMCNKGFFRELQLKRHLLVHSRKSNKQTVTREKNKFCHVCNKAFYYESSLKHHALTHAARNPYRCDLCHRVFILKGNFVKHTCLQSEERFSLPHNVKSLTVTHTSKEGAVTVIDENELAVVMNEKKVVSKDELTDTAGQKGELSSAGNMKGRGVASLVSERESYDSLIEQEPADRTLTRERTFKCHLCTKAFFNTNVLNRHLFTHECKPYICDLCNKTFSRNGDLKRHYMSHSAEKPYVCEVCNRGFCRQQHLKTHLLIHSRKSDEQKVTRERNQFCHVCNKAFYHESSLKRHALTHATRNPYSCDLCHRVFILKVNFVKHSCLQSEERFSRPCNIKSLTVTHSSKEGEATTVIEACTVSKNVSTDNTKGKQTSFKIDASNTADINKENGNTFSDSECLTVGNVREKGVASTVSKLKSTDNTNGKGAASKVLSETTDITKTQASAISESLSVGNMQEKDVSTFEEKKLASKATTRERRYVCNVCNKAFYDQSTLKQHTFTHTGEKRKKRYTGHVCNLCNKAFARLWDLKKPNVCEVCDRVSRPSYLKEHLPTQFARELTQIHTQISSDKNQQHICELCNKAFTQSSYLKRHRMLHNTSEKTHICEVCNKGFALPDYLYRHLLIHVKENLHF